MTALALILLLPAADDAVTLTAHRDKAGDKTAVVRTSAMAMDIATTTGGQTETKKEVSGTAYEFAEDVLDRPADSPRPTKLTRTYAEASRTAGGKEADLPFAKKTVVFEKAAGGRYTFTADGEALTGDAAKEFETDFNSAEGHTPDQEILPPHPVKVGDTWTVSSEMIARRMTAKGQFTVAAAGVTFTSKLVKLLERDGMKLAVVEQSVEIRPTDLQAGPRKLPLDAGSKLTIADTWEFCRDGTVPYSVHDGKTTIAITMTIPNGPVLTMTGAGTEKTATKPRK